MVLQTLKHHFHDFSWSNQIFSNYDKLFFIVQSEMNLVVFINNIVFVKAFISLNSVWLQIGTGHHHDRKYDSGKPLGDSKQGASNQISSWNNPLFCLLDLIQNETVKILRRKAVTVQKNRRRLWQFSTTFNCLALPFRL
jgi:hypothetical protein